MLAAAAQLAAVIFPWALRLAFVSAAFFAFLVIVNLAVSMIFVGLNQSVLNDMFALVQIWLPFNLNVVLLWFFTASLAYLTYRLSIAALTFLNRLLGNN